MDIVTPDCISKHHIGMTVCIWGSLYRGSHRLAFWSKPGREPYEGFNENDTRDRRCIVLKTPGAHFGLPELVSGPVQGGPEWRKAGIFEAVGRLTEPGPDGLDYLLDEVTSLSQFKIQRLPVDLEWCSGLKQWQIDEMRNLGADDPEQTERRIEELKLLKQKW